MKVLLPETFSPAPLTQAMSSASVRIESPVKHNPAETTTQNVGVVHTERITIQFQPKQ